MKYKHIKIEISSHKDIMGGTWCIEGTRIPVISLMRYLNLGYTKWNILRVIYPTLKGKLK